MTAFDGSFHHKIDAKGRLSLPADYRRSLKQDLKLVLSPEKDYPSLWVFDADEFTNWLDHYFDKRGGYDPSNQKMSRWRKVMASRAAKCQMDDSGRIRLTAEQREKAGLSGDVMIIGDFDHLEIWDTDRWNAFEEEVMSLDWD
ncbi:MAG: division/cell wall cluster transcriptional repressor MraZ [Coriobacteriia bacterium]|nr:division/cell wall cluster transcriptional repressor MraZ [Coriobacteriia bacterium]